MSQRERKREKGQQGRNAVLKSGERTRGVRRSRRLRNRNDCGIGVNNQS